MKENIEHSERWDNNNSTQLALHLNKQLSGKNNKTYIVLLHVLADRGENIASKFLSAKSYNRRKKFLKDLLHTDVQKELQRMRQLEKLQSS
jgi:hypothetical protein